mmetsp:Transcript_14224/g.20743  ORF Transcript_14224/g.20743 Transcript_14224/m.20743 type:complete len:219 (+) Transcript_14224:709-1365(+)
MPLRSLATKHLTMKSEAFVHPVAGLNVGRYIGIDCAGVTDGERVGSRSFSGSFSGDFPAFFTWDLPRGEDEGGEGDFFFLLLFSGEIVHSMFPEMAPSLFISLTSFGGDFLLGGMLGTSISEELLLLQLLSQLLLEDFDPPDEEESLSEFCFLLVWLVIGSSLIHKGFSPKSSALSAGKLECATIEEFLNASLSIIFSIICASSSIFFAEFNAAASSQ